MKPLQVIIEVVNASGRFQFVGEKLKMHLRPPVSLELKNALRENKAALIGLLRREYQDWCLLRAKALNDALVFYVTNDAIKREFVAMGAHPEMIYTRDEISALRNGSIDSSLIPQAHEARVVLGGRFRTAP